MLNRFQRQSVYNGISGLLNLGLTACFAFPEEMGNAIHAIRFGLVFITFINSQLIRYNNKHMPMSALAIEEEAKAKIENTKKWLQRSGDITAAATATGTVASYIAPLTPYPAFASVGTGIVTIFTPCSIYPTVISNTGRRQFEEAAKTHLSMEDNQTSDREAEEFVAAESERDTNTGSCLDRVFRRFGW
jgi:hypothetical protein